MHMSRMFNLMACVAVLIAATQVVADEPKSDSKTDNKLIGTWKLVSAKYDGKDSNLLETTTTLKHITPTQMMWVSYDMDGKVTRAAGGTYTLKGDDFSDTPEYGVGSDFSAVKGETHTFKCKIEGNKWYHTGKLASGLKIEEVWERVEKK
jgi:hypothetical protein